MDPGRMMDAPDRLTLTAVAGAATACCGFAVLLVSDWATGNDIPAAPWFIGWGVWGLGALTSLSSMAVTAVMRQRGSR